MPNDRRLPLSGLEQMDLHAAQERLRRAQLALQRARREMEMADNLLRQIEQKLGLGPPSSYEYKKQFGYTDEQITAQAGRRAP